MADVNGKSGPFAPAIGLNTSRLCLIGLPSDLAGFTAACQAGTFQQAAAGDFIGMQSIKSGPYSQAQGDVPADFDASFAVLTYDGTYTPKGGNYIRASANQYSFSASGITQVATSCKVTLTTNNQAHATGNTITVIVYDQVGRPMPGVTVAFADGTGGTENGTETPASIATDATGTSVSVVTAAAAGTIVTQVTAAPVPAPAPVTHTLT